MDLVLYVDAVTVSHYTEGKRAHRVELATTPRAFGAPVFPAAKECVVEWQDCEPDAVLGALKPGDRVRLTIEPVS